MIRVFACLILLIGASVGGFAHAQNYSAAMSLDRLNSPDSAERLGASNALQRMDTRAIPALIDRLNLIAPLYLADKNDRSYGPFLADILNVLSIIFDNSAQKASELIRTTRPCDFVANLAKLAGSDDRTIRVSATKVLLRIVDDNTVELVSSLVLPMLKEGNVNGATNLLSSVQVNLAEVSAGTKDKLGPLIGSIDAYFNSPSLDQGNALSVLQDIKARLTSSQRGAQARPTEQCNPGSFLTNASPKPRIAYIHTAAATLSPELRARLQGAVQSYGVKVRGFDADVDSVGGIGVDYFDEADRPVAQQMADAVGSLIGRSQFLPRKQSSKLNQQGVFGIWLPPPQ